MSEQRTGLGHTVGDEAADKGAYDAEHERYEAQEERDLRVRLALQLVEGLVVVAPDEAG